MLTLERVRIKNGHLEVQVAGASFVSIPPVRPLLLRQAVIPMALPGAETHEVFQNPDDENGGTVPIENAVQDPRLAALILQFQEGSLPPDGPVKIPTEAEAWKTLKAASL